MKTLLLLRHAKSSWKDESLDDHERPLNARGRRDAPRMGTLLANQELVPKRIVTSTAVRARTTAHAVADAAGYAADVFENEDLYLASPVTILEIAGAQPDDVESLLLVAHNPGMEMLVSAIARRSSTMPTAALAHVEVETDAWRGIESAEMRLVELWRPKELPD